MRLLFDQNLSFKLCALLDDLYPDDGLRRDRGGPDVEQQRLLSGEMPVGIEPRFTISGAEFPKARQPRSDFLGWRNWTRADKPTVDDGLEIAMFDQAVTMNATQLLAGKNTPTARLQSAQHFKGGSRPERR